MVLRYLLIQHENKKRQQEADDRELAPYQAYLDEAIKRGLAQERAIIAQPRTTGRRPQISLAEALVKLPLKSLQEIDNQLWLARHEKRLACRFRREFLDWIRATKPNLSSRDPQERVEGFAKKFNWPILGAYEEGIREGRRIAREEQEAHRTKPTTRDGDTTD